MQNSTQRYGIIQLKVLTHRNKSYYIHLFEKREAMVPLYLSLKVEVIGLAGASRVLGLT